jgi:hypothetical protein
VAAVTDDAREQQLAWEAPRRPRAGVAAIVAAVLTLAGFIWFGIELRDVPSSGFLESLGSAAEPGAIGEQPSVQAPAIEYYADRSFGLIGNGVLRCLGVLALGWVVTFLAVATRARRAEFPRLAVYVALVGTVLLGLGTIAQPIDRAIVFSDFLDGPRTVDDARDLTTTFVITTELLNYIGRFLVAAGLLLVSLNAMRAGLLTRFLGIIGVVSGVLFVFPQLMPVPVVLAFWCIAVGLMLLGVGNLPPAWRTGKAEPWPTATGSAQRGRAAEERKQGIPRPEPEPQPVPAGRPHPASKKRKRKRRG